MRLQLKTRKKDGNILTRIYYCPCGNGEIVEDQDYTPGHRDTFVSIECPLCQERYYINYVSRTQWNIMHDYTSYFPSGEKAHQTTGEQTAKDKRERQNMKKNQTGRLTEQHKKNQGVIGIFGEEAKHHDHEVGYNSIVVQKMLEEEFPTLQFRYRKDITKEEINNALSKVDSYLGQTLFVKNSHIIPDGGIIEVKDDNGNWRVVLVSEAKHQGKDIENIKKGQLVGKNNDQDLMVAGNAIERAHKNIWEIANYMLSEAHFPYVLFLEGSNFLTHDITVMRPDGREVTLTYNSGALNRLDRLTASNYGMPINTNLCENKFVMSNNRTIMLQAASIFTQSDGEHWSDEEMIEVMLDIAHTSIRMLGKDVFDQLTKRK